MKKLSIILFPLLLTTFVVSFVSCDKFFVKEKYGCDCENVSTGYKTIVVGPDKREHTYSTYDDWGEHVADAACHANMKLVFRWADNNKAATDTNRPPLYYQFQSVFGYFASNPGMEVEKTEDGFHVWEITISEAIDKNTPQASSYGIYVKYDGDLNASNANILCKVEIEYKTYDENAYELGCK